MKETEFLELSISKQAHIVFEQGKELTSRQYVFYQIKLFSLFSFFVEIWNIPDSNKIEKIKIIEIDEIFNIYNNELDISGLYDYD